MVDLKMEVYSPALELLGFLEIHNSVIWEEKAFSSGSFSVDSLITPKSLALLQPENIIWIEGDTAGIIEYVNEKADTNGPYITVKGYTLTGILDRRILWGRYDMSGTPPAIMHSLVNGCCINPTRGNVEARKIPGLVLLDAPTGGESIRIQKTGGSLLEALEQIGETYGVAFGVRFNAEIPRMEFWTRWGRDLTVHQSDNPQVFYSTELDDVLESEYTYNSQDYRNVSLVGGEGEGNDRVYVTVEEDIEETPDVPVNPPTPPEPAKYTIALLVDPEGGGTASGGKTVAAGVNITVTAAPSAGYAFSGWSENGNIVSASASYTFTVDANRTLTAVFTATIPTYTITASIDPTGSGTVTGAGQYQEGAEVTITATPEEGYTFSGWKEGGVTVSESETYTFTVTGNRAFVAAFTEAKPSRLPAGYTEAEYIRFEGNKTSLKLQENIVCNTDRLTIKFYPESYGTSSAPQYLFNIYSSVSGSYYYINASSKANNNLTYCLNVVSGSARIASTNTVNNMLEFDLDFYGNSYRVNAVSLNGTRNTNSLGTGAKLIGASGSTASSAKGKLYQVSHYRSGNLIHDYIPCINPDGVAGLFDINTNTFIQNTNANATAITPGPAV